MRGFQKRAWTIASWLMISSLTVTPLALHADNTTATSTPAVSNTVSPSTASESPDTSAPETVSGLSISQPSTSTLPLFWVTPRDSTPAQTSVPADRYQIAYGTAMITESSWPSASKIEYKSTTYRGIGESDTYTLTGLSPSTTYFIGIKALDVAGNMSPIASFSGQTTAPSAQTTTTVATPMGGWPTSQNECDNMSGTWCSPSGVMTMGSCVMAGMSCPSATAVGSCWDGSAMPSGGGCPTMPTTQAGCVTLGKNWCSSAGGTGWCSKDPCMAMPPAGKMTCPDNKTFVSSFQECPKKTSTITPTPKPEPTPAPTPEPTPVPTPTTVQWPMTSTDCQLYKGKWCPMASMQNGGSCVSANMPCWTQPSEGMMSCWDGSQVAFSGRCPEVPMTESGCKQIGKNWCQNSASSTTAASSTGWCSGQPCMPIPPTGMMTCPDGTSFKNKLADCPHAIEERVSQDKKYVQCASGAQILEGATCPQKDIVPPPDQIEKEKIDEQSREETHPIDARQIERRKQSLLQELTLIGKTLKKYADSASLAKLALMKERAQTVKIDLNADEELSSLEADLALLRDLKNSILSQKQKKNKKSDIFFKERALKELRAGLTKLEPSLTSIATRMARVAGFSRTLDHFGLSLGESFNETRDTLLSSQSLLQDALKAKTYDDVLDKASILTKNVSYLKDSLGDIVEWENLVRRAQTLTFIEKRLPEFTNRITAIEKTDAANRSVNLSDGIRELKDSVRSLADRLSAIVANSSEEIDDADVMIEQLMSDTENFDDDLNAYVSLANIKKYASSMNALAKNKYAKAYQKLEKKDSRRNGTKKLLTQLNSDVARLQKIKVNDASKEKLLLMLDRIVDTTDQLNDLLNLPPTNAFDSQLRTIREESSAIPSAGLSDLEDTITSADHMVNFLQ